MVSQSCNELEEIIRIICDGDQSGRHRPLRDPEYIITMMDDHLSSDDSNNLMQTISWLLDDFNKSKDEYMELKPYISIMIAYANCKLNDQQGTLYYAQAAVEQFRQIPNLWNQAGAFWFLGIVFRYNGHSETEKVLKTAIKLLEENAQEAEKHRKYNFLTRDLCNKYIRRIEQNMHELASSATSHFQQEKKESKGRKIGFFDKFRQPSTPNISGPASTPMKKNTLIVNTPQLGQTRRDAKAPSQKQESTRTLSSRSRPSSFHIIIPVDTQALMNPQAVSNSLDQNLYDRLKEYNLWRSDQVSINASGKNKNYQPANKQRYIIPQFPIFGRATAGSKGAVTFEQPEIANGVTEDNQIALYGIKHKVFSTKEKDTRINTGGKKNLGWLKIDGESMNIAMPIPIDNQDYVLFYKINNLEACEDKIVIASKPGLDEQYPILLIKRLVAMIPTSTKSSTIYKKYYLHSESSREKYKDDIEFTEENQLIGEVIAVAKPVK